MLSAFHKVYFDKQVEATIVLVFMLSFKLHVCTKSLVFRLMQCFPFIIHLELSLTGYKKIFPYNKEINKSVKQLKFEAMLWI